MSSDKIESFSITLSNAIQEKTVIGFDKKSNQYYIDRTQSGKVNFEKGFAAKATAPGIFGKDSLDITLVIDNASVELFADNGLSVRTAIFFPNQLYSEIKLQSPGKFIIQKLKYDKLKRIWK